MLATRFPRLKGDIGNPETFDFPVLYRTVESATVAAVVGAEEVEAVVAQGILHAAAGLASDGARLIATSCGFLGGLQDQLQRAVEVPVISSSLVLLPFLRAVHGRGRPLGVLTFDSRRLAPRHFGPHHDRDIVIEGVEDGAELHRVVSRDLTEMNAVRAERDVVDCALRLQARAPETAALVLECTNFSPYRDAVARATGLPVYDLVQAIWWQADAMAAAAASS